MCRRSRAFAAVLALITGCGPPAADLEADAILMPPDSPPIRGREAIREHVEAAASIPGFSTSSGSPSASTWLRVETWRT